MNSQCSIALLESALAGNLPAEDETALNCHLEVCEACSAALERIAGGPAWCREAASLLTEDELDAAVPTRDEWSEIDFTVEHLEPSDAPNVLGRLGGYDVLEIIGHGGMGVVLKGFDRELKRLVAIKVLAPHLARSSLAKKRFAREAQAAAAVVHPNVLPIHQVHAAGRLPFLVMPLVTGESLAERLAAQGSLELKETLRIGMQAAAGLAAAHEQGLVHRDVKPANILLEKGVERAVLTDFGLARAADDVTLTRWGIVAGTPQYMSPEQARGEPLDGRSDLFSLGCVLYEMATGVSPFRTDSVMATMRRLVDDSPQAMQALNPELPPWFIAIVDRLLEKDPSRRFGSAKEVSDLLEGCLAHVQQPANVPLPEQLRNATSSKRGRWSVQSLLAGAVFGLALLLAGVVIVLELNKGTLTIESDADDVSVRITQRDEVVEKLTVTRAGKKVRIAAGTYVVEIDGEAHGIAVKNGKVAIERGGTEIVRIVRHDVAKSAESIAKQVALRIEALKSKYPHLEKFSAAQHLSKREPDEPGALPEKYSINFDNAVVMAEAPPESGSENQGLQPQQPRLGLGPRRRAPEYIYDPKTGIQLDVRFYKGGKIRGSDLAPAYRIGDLGVSVHVRGPAGEAIRGEISQVLEELGAERAPNIDDGARQTPPPSTPETSPAPKHPSRISGNGDSNGEQPRFNPTLADPPPGSSDRTADGSSFSETKELVLSMDSLKFMLDLDTGETMDPPARTGRPEQEKMDVHPTQIQPYDAPTGLSGISLEGINIKPNGWDASPSNLRRSVTGVRLQPLIQMPYDAASPGTYFFKTRAGTEGILQLLAVVDEPKGIRIRYKTLQSDTTTAKEQQTARGDSAPIAPDSRDQTSRPRGKLDMEQKLIGTWVGHADRFAERYTFWADGTFQQKGMVQVLSTEEGTWAFDWDTLPPTLVLQVTKSDHKEAPVGAILKHKVVALDDKRLAFENPNDTQLVWDASRPITYTRAKESPTTAGKRASVPEKLFATEEHVAAIKELIKDAPVTTNYLAELFERNPKFEGEYRLRSDVITIPIVPAEKSKLDFVPMGNVHYLPASKHFYLQWDNIAASTRHYYGPFYGVRLEKLGLTRRSSDEKQSGPQSERKTTEAVPQLVHHFQTSDNVNKIAISSDGTRIAIANGNPTFILQSSGTSRLKDNWKPSVEILDGKTGKPATTLKLSTAEEDAVLAATQRVAHFEVNDIAFSPDESVLAIGTSIGQLKLFNAQTGELVRSLDDEKPKLADKETPENWKSLSRAMGSVQAIAFSPDGALLAVCGSSFADFSDVFDGIERLGRSGTGPGRLKVWDVKTGTLKHDLAGHSQAFAVAFSWDGSMLASTGRWSGTDHGNRVLVWNPQTGTKTRTILIEANGGTHFVAFSPNKKLMAFGSVNYDKENDTSASTVSVAYPLSGITEWQQTVPGWARPAFSPDGKTIAVLCGTESIRFVDTETGAPKHEIKAADSAPGGRWNDFAIASQTTMLAIGGIDAEKRGFVAVWDLDGASSDAR